MTEATKVSNVVTYGKRLPIIKSHEHLNKWWSEVTWPIKNIKSDLWQYLLSPNLSEWWLTARGSHLYGVVIFIFYYAISICRIRTQTPKSSPTSCFKIYLKAWESILLVLYECNLLFSIDRSSNWRNLSTIHGNKNTNAKSLNYLVFLQKQSSGGVL